MAIRAWRFCILLQTAALNAGKEIDRGGAAPTPTPYSHTARQAAGRLAALIRVACDSRGKRSAYPEWK